MKIRKTILALCATLALTFGLTACGEASTYDAGFETQYPELIPEIAKQGRQGCEFASKIAYDMGEARYSMTRSGAYLGSGDIKGNTAILTKNVLFNVRFNTENPYPALEGKSNGEIQADIKRTVTDVVYYLMETGNNYYKNNDISTNQVSYRYYYACMYGLTLRDVAEQDIPISKIVPEKFRNR